MQNKFVRGLFYLAGKHSNQYSFLPHVPTPFELLRHDLDHVAGWQSLSSLLEKASELNGVKWGARAGIRGGGGKMFLESGAGTSILDWLSGEARPGQYGEVQLGGAGESAFG